MATSRCALSSDHSRSRTRSVLRSPAAAHQARVMTVTEPSFAKRSRRRARSHVPEGSGRCCARTAWRGRLVDNALVIGDTACSTSRCGSMPRSSATRSDLIAPLAGRPPGRPPCVVTRGGHSLHTAMASQCWRKPLRGSRVGAVLLPTSGPAVRQGDKLGSTPDSHSSPCARAIAPFFVWSAKPGRNSHLEAVREVLHQFCEKEARYPSEVSGASERDFRIRRCACGSCCFIVAHYEYKPTPGSRSTGSGPLRDGCTGCCRKCREPDPLRPDRAGCSVTELERTGPVGCARRRHGGRMFPTPSPATEGVS